MKSEKHTETYVREMNEKNLELITEGHGNFEDFRFAIADRNGDSACASKACAFASGAFASIEPALSGVRFRINRAGAFWRTLSHRALSGVRFRINRAGAFWRTLSHQSSRRFLAHAFASIEPALSGVRFRIGRAQLFFLKKSIDMTFLIC